MRGLIKLFAKSPFGLLVTHTGRVQETVQLLRPLIAAFLAGDQSRLNELHDEICKKEHKADETKAAVRDHMPKSVFLPVNRGDVLNYVKEQDGIADAVEDLAVILKMRTPKIIPELEPKLLAVVDQVVAAADDLFHAARGMTNLAASSFAGPEVDKVLEMVAKVNHAEWEADKLQAEFSALVFQHEDELDPISVFQWVHIVEVLGDVADHAENSGDMLRLMLARS
jgi:predicted phosphate transport protein (TIGR00153 family)